MKKNEHILFHTPHNGEMEFQHLCELQYKRIISILEKIENEFNISMNDHQELRKFILDISNYTRRTPDMVSELIKSVGDSHDIT